MVSITLAVSDEFKKELLSYSWVNWSEIAREETKKKIIFEKYMKTRKVSDKDWKFCEKIDWHPVDELPLKKEFIRKILGSEGKKAIKLNSVSDILR